MNSLSLDFYLEDERNAKFQEFVNKLSHTTLDMMQYVFNILKIYKMDNDSYYASGFFVSISKEDTDYEQIKKDYGTDIADMLQKLNSVGFQSPSMGDVEYVRNMFMGMVKDIRVLIILLTYNLYRAEHIDQMVEEESQHFARTLKDIYAPLAARLGLREIKNKMENIVFKFYDPEIYEQLSKDDLLNKKERLTQINKAIEKIKIALKELNIHGKVYGREKHLASVYNKLKEKKTTLSQIYDLMAIRVVVNTVEECYLVLGKINSVFTVLPNRFKDYIATPKANGYKSIHTCILSQNNRPIEVQIRTQEMHHYNEYGVAAHWIYKDKGHKASNRDESISWLKEIIEENKGLPSKDFVENISRNMFRDEIFAQTPNGKVMRFPAGANCIDFAYAVHTDIGNRCVGAKINGKIVPIVTELKNGDVCEIILGANNKKPSRDWLNIVKTATARSSINTFFKKEFVEENIKNGKSAMEAYAKTIGSSLQEIQSSEKLPDMLKKYNLNNINELFSLVGNQSLKAESVVNRLVAVKVEKSIKFSKSNAQSKDKNNIVVAGQKTMLTHLAKCCTPIKGDEIVGYVTMGKGVVVHRKDCVNLHGLNKDRFLDAHWVEGSKEEYLIKLRVLFEKNAVLSKVADILEKLNIKIISLNISPYNNLEINLSVIVSVVDDVNKIINRIKALDNVKFCGRV